MYSRIRIGFLAVLILFFLAPFLSFAQTRPESLPPLDSLSLSTMNQLAAGLLSTGQALEGILKAQQDTQESELSGWQSQMGDAKQDTTASKFLLDSLSKEIKESKKILKETSQLYARATKTASFTASLAEMDSLNLRKNLPKAWKQISQLYDELYPPPPVEKVEKEELAVREPKQKKEKKKKEPEPAENPDKPDEPMAQPPAVAKPVIARPAAKKYNPAANVMLNPPTPACVIASSSRDEFSGEISREMARAELFRYTNPALKAYLKGKTHIICEAALSSSGTKTSLLLTFNINDPNARKAFGRLEKNSIATLKFLDGSIFELQNAIADDGVFNPENDASIFHAAYPLNPEALKKIRRTGLDKLRILWSKGYDDYDIQQVDLLMRQAECLFK